MGSVPRRRASYPMDDAWLLFFVLLTARLPFLERESIYGCWWSAREKERGRELTCRQRNGGLAVLLARGFRSFQSAERESGGSQAQTLSLEREREIWLKRNAWISGALCTRSFFMWWFVSPPRDSGIHTRFVVQAGHKGSSRNFFHELDLDDRPLCRILWVRNMPEFYWLWVLISRDTNRITNQGELTVDSRYRLSWHQPKH